jgi:hypothetical protein
LEGTVVAVGPGIKDRVGIYFFRQINTVWYNSNTLQVRNTNEYKDG